MVPPAMWDSRLNWIKRKRWKSKAWQIIFVNETFSFVSKPEVHIFGLVNSGLVYMQIHKFQRILLVTAGSRSFQTV